MEQFYQVEVASSVIIEEVMAEVQAGKQRLLELSSR